MVTDLSSPVSQAQFGDLVGISQQAVSLLMQRKILVDGASADEWLLAYCDHLRSVAAGRGGDASLELAAERARLAKEQADKIAMQNAVTRGELAPAYLLEEVLARVGAKAGRILETIPGLVRRRQPQLTSDDIAAVADVVAKARNLVAKMNLAEVDTDDQDSGISSVDIVDEDQAA
ncbi:terminase small subunit [Pseudoxanthomonas indica]|uniref:terminase small subunit n=1 Tax=Pseudoxanthomonas indica TaxID=428993 RepID=UPI001C37BC34|nr:terminase small subunit [Pseudoxanthomonas indica]